eukprot:jgi/Hompol1/947/HPOL_003323-RA
MMRVAREVMNSGAAECMSDVSLVQIVDGTDQRRTLMIKNIPNKYTQAMFLELLNETVGGQYDFVYLRIDFKNRCNVGYAFVNFASAEAIVRFAERHVGRPWARFKSEKICGMAFAAIQGRRSLVDKFRNSSVMLEDEVYRPRIFYTSGPLRGQEEPFPGPSHTGFRPKIDVLYSRDRTR